VRTLKRKSITGNTIESWDHFQTIRKYEVQVFLLKKELGQMCAVHPKNPKTIFLTDSPIRLVRGGAGSEAVGYFSRLFIDAIAAGRSSNRRVAEIRTALIQGQLLRLPKALHSAASDKIR
jgi:hypothetical protein